MHNRRRYCWQILSTLGLTVMLAREECLYMQIVAVRLARFHTVLLAAAAATLANKHLFARSLYVYIIHTYMRRSIENRSSPDMNAHTYTTHTVAFIHKYTYVR